MPITTCVCRSCVDPREHGFFPQHGLPLYNGFYMPRNKGAFVPKPSGDHDISTTGLMLVQMNRAPSFVIQGHRDCAAIRILFDSHQKDSSHMNETEREFLRSHHEALETVMKTAAKLPPDQQLRILEKICVLQSINNVFDYKDLKEKKEIVPAIYGYYSLTPLPPTNEQLVPEKIELMIFDPRKGVFAYSPHRDNKGIRISDLMDAHTLVPHSHDVLKVSIPIDISVITRNEVDYAVAGRIPIADNIIKPQKPSPPRKQEVGKECSQS